MGTQSYCGHGVVKHCLGEGTQTRPGPQLTAAHGDPGSHFPAFCAAGAAAMAACAAGAADASSAQAVVVAAGDPVAVTRASARISFRSIFPPDVMIGSASLAMLAPAIPA
ncbi:hypothetical protein ABT061_27500 [Streptosporangium sp. NPDC002544]|uniref:hypothetical protein n=1 Tax=Streptosporangium sp. NPDC002544 TaxID=3154538 RepID=UPI00332F39F7